MIPQSKVQYRMRFLNFKVWRVLREMLLEHVGHEPWCSWKLGLFRKIEVSVLNNRLKAGADDVAEPRGEDQLLVPEAP